MFAGTHNSMSSPLYPGWLFGEQIGPIGDQLNGGVRALLFDTHYGVPSRSRMPGSQTPIVLTDRARELANPEFEQADPGVVDRANALAERAPKAADADSSIYLCHNYCELGAISFATVLADIKEFVDTHPDDVIVIDHPGRHDASRHGAGVRRRRARGEHRHAASPDSRCRRCRS